MFKNQLQHLSHQAPCFIAQVWRGNNASILTSLRFVRKGVIFKLKSMTTLAQENAVSTEVRNLKNEMRLLRSFVIGLVAHDEEGEYNPRFVKKILKAAQEKSVGVFKDKESFLKLIS